MTFCFRKVITTQTFTVKICEAPNYFIKEYPENLARLIQENIIAFREYLINKLNADLMLQIADDAVTNKLEILEFINDYNKLKVTITRKIGRMRTTFG